jgi:hypothetical protein
MTWHTEVVPKDALRVLLDRIRRTGGTVTNSRTCSSGYRITYVTVDDRDRGSDARTR